MADLGWTEHMDNEERANIAKYPLRIARTVVTRTGKVLMYSSSGELLAVGRVYKHRVKDVSGWSGRLEKPICSREVGWPSDRPLRTRREVIEWLEDLAHDAIEEAKKRRIARSANVSI